MKPSELRDYYFQKYCATIGDLLLDDEYTRLVRLRRAHMVFLKELKAIPGFSFKTRRLIKETESCLEKTQQQLTKFIAS